MKSKPLANCPFLIIPLLLFFVTAKGQGGSKLVADIGLSLQTQPLFNADLQLKHYWLMDSAVSNDGPGIGAELNFGSNNSGTTFGFKVFYQLDVFLAEIGRKKKNGLYLVSRFSFIRYTNTHGNDIRLTPEGGLSLFDTFTLFYGYNFAIPYQERKQIPGVFNNRITLLFTIGGKENNKR